MIRIIKISMLENGRTGSGRLGAIFSPLGLKVAGTFYFEVVPMF